MASELGKAYVQIVPSAKGISGAISKEMQGESESAGISAGKSLVGSLKKVIVAAGIGKAIASVINEGGKLQQSLGGVETLFKDNADKVKEYANQAYKTTGLSANAYMENVTGFSASLLQSLGGDTKKAADIANMAMVDMADNSNKMGTSMESIQNAYQGFAKQNYTMLDNLKLGYGGTKSEMQRLLADATKLTGVKYDINNLSDVYSAIHAIQGKLDITGTTAKEASTTFAGSFAAMKAAATNVMGKLTIGENIGPSLIQLAGTVKTFLFNNLIPMVWNIAKGIPLGIIEAVKTAGPSLLIEGGKMIDNLLNGIKQKFPQFAPVIDGFKTTFENAFNGIKNIIDTVLSPIFNELAPFFESVFGTIGGIIEDLFVNRFNFAKAYAQTLIDFITANLPSIQETFTNVFKTIKKVWDTVLLPVFNLIKQIIIDITNIVIQNLPWIQSVWQQVWDGISTFTSVVMGIIRNSIIPIFQVIIGWVQENWPIIKEVIEAVINQVKFVIQTVLTWIQTFWTNWGATIITTVTSIFSGIQAFIGAVLDTIKGIINIVLGLIEGDWSRVWEGIKQVVSGVWDAIKGIVSAAIEVVKTVLATAWAIIETTAITVWNVIKDKISSIWESIKSAVSSAINSVKTTVSDIWNSIKSTTESIWNGIKKAITDPIEAAKNKVKSVIDAIKGFFNFKISWPHIPVPSFAISPSGWKLGDLLKGSIPSLGIKWHADGGIFTKPTVIGNHGFGEAGAEAILPLSKLPGLIAPTLQRMMGENKQGVTVTNNNTFVLENVQNLTREKLEQIAEWLEERQNESVLAIGGNI